MRDDVKQLVERLRLAPHPEGGFFRETYRSPLQLQGLPHGGPRSASTLIYFLLPAGTFSAFHRVSSDETWHHYDGDPVALHVITETGTHVVHHLGRRLDAGQEPQAVVPANAWQAAEPLGEAYALCGCTVSPGFDFADFRMGTRQELAARFPAARDVVERLTRS